jgi:hypothetical protein
MKTAFGNMATDYIGEKAFKIKTIANRIMQTMKDINDYGEFFPGTSDQNKCDSRVHDMLLDAQMAQIQLNSLIRELKKGLGEQ